MKRKFLSLLVAVCMVTTMLPTTVFAEDIAIGMESIYQITAFDELGGNFEKAVPFDGSTYTLAVEQGTSVEELNLPDQLGVTLEGTNSVTTPPQLEVKDLNKIKVSWKSDKDFNSDKDGETLFIAEIPEGYVLASGVKLPQINVIVERQAKVTNTHPTAAEYGMDATNGIDYTIDGTILTIQTDKGAAFWSASDETYLNYTINLATDIDVSKFEWTPVGYIDENGNPISFSGTFDGGGHTISGMNFASDRQLYGVFGCVSGAVIKDLTVSGSINATDVGSNWVDENPGFAAGIVSAAIESTITNCHSEMQITININSFFVTGGITATARDNVKIDGCSNDGTITADASNMLFIGGIVGDMETLSSGSSIINCANTGYLMASVKQCDNGQIGLIYLGGIVGLKTGNEKQKDINAVVENCYNTGTLSADSVGITNVGGIAGNNDGTNCDHISNCYNVGTVTGTGDLASLSGGIVGNNGDGSVYSSYWKTDTASTCVQTGGYVYNCGTLDWDGEVTATTNKNAGTMNSENSLLYGSNLVAALNGWVDGQPDNYYYRWKADRTATPINGGYPVFDVEGGNSTFDFCNGEPTLNEKPSAIPTWGVTGYTFAGWYTKPNGEGNELTGDGDMGVTYYAKWTIGTGESLRTVRTTSLDLTSQSLDEDQLSTQGWAWYFTENTAKGYGSKTLVLSDLTLSTAEATALSVPGDTTIVVKENTTNTIKGGDRTSDSGNVSVYGLYGKGALTIEGSGTLSVIAGKATCTNKENKQYKSNSAGIYSVGNMNIDGDVIITGIGGDATCLDERGRSCGINSADTLTIHGGTVTGVGSKVTYEKESSDTSSYGISGFNVVISSGTVIGRGGPDTQASYGINAGSIEISGGSVMCYGGSGKVENSIGILSISMKITGGTVTATGGTAMVDGKYGWSCGLNSLFNIVLSGGTVTAIGGEAITDSYGICSPILMISDGTVQGMGGKAGADSCGIYSAYSLLISGGTVQGVGNDASADSYGIYSAYSFLISGGTVQGVGSDAGTGSYGICSASEIDGEVITLTITGGRVTASNGMADDKAAILAFNSSKEPGSLSILTVGNIEYPATITNATDGIRGVTASTSTITSGKLMMLGSEAIVITFSGYTVTFNANGGNVIPATIAADKDGKLASLPIPSHTGNYSFDGWFTAASGGTRVTTSAVFSANTTIYAHWTYLGESGSGNSYTSPVDNRAETVVTVPVEVPFTNDEKGNVFVTITQEKLNQILREAIEIAVQKGVKEKGIIAELIVNTPVETKSLTINLPKLVQDRLVKEGIAEVKIKTSAIEVSFDKEAIGAIQSTTGMDAQMIAKPFPELSDQARAVIGNRPVFDLTLIYGSKTMNSFGKGKVHVGIPYTLGKNEQPGNITVVYVDEGGKVNWLTQSSYDVIKKMVNFTTDHFSTYGIAYKSDTARFGDIEGHWAKEDILFMVNRGLFTGTENNKFDPDLPITKGMFVTVLGRLAQADVSSYKESSFVDVAPDAYYMGYMEWANKNDIVKGIGDGKCGPDTLVTREQMAAMIDRYATVIGFQFTTLQAEKPFADEGEISSWAKKSVRLMQMTNMMNGKTDNLFNPQEHATRAQVSAVLRRFIELTTHSDRVQD